MKRVLAATAVAILLLAACGDDSDDGSTLGGDGESTEELSAEEQAAADEVEASLLDADDGIVITEEQARCSAEAITRGLGAERTSEIEWEATDPPFSRAEAETVVDGMTSCVAANELLMGVVVAGAEVSDGSRTCAEDGISADDARTFLVESFTADSEGPDDALIESLDATLQECLTADELASI